MGTVLITGGAGYIGSHTAVALAKAGYQLVIADNLENSSEIAVERVRALTGQDIPFEKMDLRSPEAAAGVFENHPHISAVIHFAGYKAVGESVEKPLMYYDNNLRTALNTLAAMEKHGVKNFVFSSTATVYGVPETVPIPESEKLAPESPYARTKLMIEQICRDIGRAKPEMNIALLRYFNPIGAHESGRIGEDPRGIPNNLVPYIARVAGGILPEVRVFGNDYATKDGTCVRDYIHVEDLAEGHVAALQKLAQNPGVVTYNLGTGIGYSVLDVIEAYGKAVGKPIPYVFTPRRPGDIDSYFGDPALAAKELGWKAKRTLADMCRSSWNWQRQNPMGYETKHE